MYSEVFSLQINANDPTIKLGTRLYLLRRLGLFHKTQDAHKSPAHEFSFLKSNSFINILQSFIHGYVIIYFFSATLQVSIFHAVWRQQQQQINKKKK